METFLLYLDESGSLAQESCRFVTAAALIVAKGDADRLRYILPRIRKKLSQRQAASKEMTGEFKFRTLYGRRAFDVIYQVMAAISHLPCHLVIVRIDKGCQVIEDSPLNYAILLSEVIRLSRQHYPKIEYIFDRHYPPGQFHKLQSINHWLAQMLGEPLDILHQDSQDPDYAGLGLVDFVVGVARFIAEAEQSAAAYVALRDGLALTRELILEETDIVWDDLAGKCHEALWKSK